jgi:membrane glycosyltransferase
MRHLSELEDGQAWVELASADDTSMIAWTISVVIILLLSDDVSDLGAWHRARISNRARHLRLLLVPVLS